MEAIEVVAEMFDGSGKFGGRNLGFGGQSVFSLWYGPLAAISGVQAKIDQADSPTPPIR